MPIDVFLFMKEFCSDIGIYPYPYRVDDVSETSTISFFIYKESLSAIHWGKDKIIFVLN